MVDIEYWSCRLVRCTYMISIHINVHTFLVLFDWVWYGDRVDFKWNKNHYSSMTDSQTYACIVEPSWNRLIQSFNWIHTLLHLQLLYYVSWFGYFSLNSWDNYAGSHSDAAWLHRRVTFRIRVQYYLFVYPLAQPDANWIEWKRFCFLKI